jgi:hypothetical protein
MLSIIICSVNPVYLNQVKENISSTIGIEYELLVWDNIGQNKSLCEVYNAMASQAQFQYLCFMHEDIIFRTKNWGQIIVNNFHNDSDLGLIGIAGSKYKSKTLSGWSTGIKNFDCCNIFHVDSEKKEIRIYSNPENALLSTTVNLDGVFICAKKEVTNKIKFDQEMLDGFHLYDLDFSFRASNHYGVAVTFEIDITHLTEGGDFGDKWMHYTLLWHKAYAKELPRNISGLNINASSEREIKKNWLHMLSLQKISWQNKFRWIILTKSYAHVLLWPHIGYFLFFNTYKQFVSRSYFF